MHFCIGRIGTAFEDSLRCVDSKSNIMLQVLLSLANITYLFIYLGVEFMNEHGQTSST